MSFLTLLCDLRVTNMIDPVEFLVIVIMLTLFTLFIGTIVLISFGMFVYKVHTNNGINIYLKSPEQ
jgi:hypothetical protein